MRAGRLDRTVTIERVVTTFDEARTAIETWSTLATLRAEVVEAEDSEQPREPGASTTIGLVLRTRFIPTVTPGDRVVFGTGKHEIVGVREIGRRRGLEIRCSTRAA